MIKYNRKSFKYKQNFKIDWPEPSLSFKSSILVFLNELTKSDLKIWSHLIKSRKYGSGFKCTMEKLAAIVKVSDRTVRRFFVKAGKLGIIKKTDYFPEVDTRPKIKHCFPMKRIHFHPLLQKGSFAFEITKKLLNALQLSLLLTLGLYSDVKGNIYWPKSPSIQAIEDVSDIKNNCFKNIYLYKRTKSYIRARAREKNINSGFIDWSKKSFGKKKRYAIMMQYTRRKEFIKYVNEYWKKCGGSLISLESWFDNQKTTNIFYSPDIVSLEKILRVSFTLPQIIKLNIFPSRVIKKIITRIESMGNLKLFNPFTFIMKTGIDICSEESIKPSWTVFMSMNETLRGMCSLSKKQIGEYKTKFDNNHSSATTRPVKKDSVLKNNNISPEKKEPVKSVITAEDLRGELDAWNKNIAAYEVSGDPFCKKFFIDIARYKIKEIEKELSQILDDKGS